MARKKSKKNLNSRPRAKRALGITSKAAKKPPAPKPPRRVMVLVHGGGDIPEDYYESLVSAINAQLSKPLAFISAYYSDVMTKPAMGIAAAVESPEVAKFKAAYEKQLRLAHTRTQEDFPARGMTAAGFLGIDAALADTIKEVAGYLFDANATTQVRERLIRALDQAAHDFDEIVLVSHSLGTIVSFDVLKQFAHRYKIAQWYTLGSPIGKLIKLGVRDGAPGEIATPQVARWHNVYDTNDFVAGTISPFCFSDACHVHDIFMEIAATMPAAHDYFNNAEVQAMLAGAMK
jgi:hypothetical protein